MIQQPYESLAGKDGDITADPCWDRGYIDRWRSGIKLPLLAQRSSDPVDVLTSWFAGTDHITVLGRGPSAVDEWARTHCTDAVIVTDPTYAVRDVFAGEPRGVLIGDKPTRLQAVAERFHATPAEQRPLLMHMYLPDTQLQPFTQYNLPRPVPILPLLMRRGLYRHEPHAPYPTTGVFALLLGAALDKRITVSGIDLYRHPSGRTYTNDQRHYGWPAQHSEACDVAAIRSALRRLGDNAAVNPHLTQLLMQLHGVTR